MAGFDFDHIEEWGPRLSIALGPTLPTDALTRLAKAAPEYIEDAGSAAMSMAADQNSLIEAATQWIRCQHVIAYHGSRLVQNEVDKVMAQGLRTLRMSERADRLRAILSSHPDWLTIEKSLAAAVATMAAGEQHVREGQAHLTLSRCGLVTSFNHYLVEGSEFDQHVTCALLGREGRQFLSQHGVATIFRLRVPGDRAMQAMNPFGMSPSAPPNPVRHVIDAWAYWTAYPNFLSASWKIDCGLMFFEDLPANWIVGVEPIDDAILRKTYRR